MVRLLFDRGTILVRGPAEVIERAALPGLLWDPRVGEWRAPAFRHADIVRALRGAGATFSDDVRAAAPSPGEWRDVPLRPYQREALDAWHASSGRGVVVLPTGGGKTRLAMAAMASSGVPAIVLVPTRALLLQWCRAIADAYDGAVGLYGDGERHLAWVTLATFESAYRNMDAVGNRFGMVVTDEAHHFAGGARAEALEMCAAPRRLGLTAIPPAAAEGRARLASLLGPIVYERRIGDLAGPWLADFDVVERRVELDPDEREAYDRERARFSDFLRRMGRLAPNAAWKEIAVAAARTDEGRRALEAHRRARSLLALPREKLRAVAELLDAHRDRRALVFTADNAAAYAISTALLVPAITCEIGREERERILSRFRAGAYRAVVSARVLNEGIDVPEAEVGIVVGGWLGGGEHAQRVGRLLRPRAGKRAVVYEIVVADSIETSHARRRRDTLAAAQERLALA